MNIPRDHERLADLTSEQYRLAGQEIHNLQSALFTTISAAIATLVIGLLLGLRDIVGLGTDIFRFPWGHVVPLIFWVLATFISAEAVFIFISCVSLGLFKRLIELESRTHAYPTQESRVFVPNEEAGILLRLASRVYCPSLVASGYCHSFLPTLFLLTPVLGFIVAAVHLFFLHFAQAPPTPLVPWFALDATARNPLWLLPGVMFLFYLLVNWLIVPAFTPSAYSRSAVTAGAKVLVVSETLSHQHGTEVALLGFLEGAAKARSDLCLVGPAEKGGGLLRRRCQEAGIRLCAIPAVPTWFLGQPEFRLADPFLLFYHAHPSLRAIFMNGFPGTLGVASVLLARRRRVPLIFFYHVYLPTFVRCVPIVGSRAWFRHLIDRFTAAYARHASVVIAPSNAMSRYLQSIGVSGDRIRVVPSGVHEKFCADISDQTKASVRRGFGSPLVLYVGRLSQEKRIDVLMQAFTYLLADFPSASLVIAGHGPMRKRLEGLSRSLALGHSVRFLGHVDWDQLPALYAAADCFCSASTGESQGLSILEAKACGTPCIVMDAAGSGEQVTNEVDGLLVPATGGARREANSLADSMARLLRDEGLRRTISANSKVRARSYQAIHSAEAVLRVVDEVTSFAQDRVPSVRDWTLIAGVSASLQYARMSCRKRRLPIPAAGHVLADLHAHPYITDDRSLRDTIGVLLRRGIGLLGNVVHGDSNGHERSIWELRSLLREGGQGTYEFDEGLLRVSRDGHATTLIGGYELYVCVPEVAGSMDVVVLNPDRDFARAVRGRRQFDEVLRCALDHDGVVLAAHPYTLWDPHGPGGRIPFRLASEHEQKVIRERVFPMVDSVDLVASNVLWMTQSNDFVVRDYRGRPVCSSDTHASTRLNRRQLGTSGCVFAFSGTLERGAVSRSLRETLHRGEFETYLNYMRPDEFLVGIALSRPSRDHP